MALLESKLTDDAPDRVNLLVMRAKLHLLFGNVRFIIHKTKSYDYSQATKCFHDIQAALDLDASSIEAKKLKIELERRTGQAHKQVILFMSVPSPIIIVNYTQYKEPIIIVVQAIHYCLTDRRKEALLKMDIAIDSDPYNAKHHILRYDEIVLPCNDDGSHQRCTTAPNAFI